MPMPLLPSVALATSAAAILACSGTPGTETPDPDPDGTPPPVARGPASGGPVGGEVAQEPALPPAGYGTLKQDEITAALRAGDLLLKVTPLEEWVIRLAAPDTYERLHGLAESRRARLREDAMRDEVTLFLVSFFSYTPNVTYQPEDLQISNQGRRFRPLAIAPVTPGWDRQRLAQQESQLAIYAFDERIVLDRPMTVEYQLARNSSWEQVVSTLEEERAKVLTRASSDPGRR